MQVLDVVVVGSGAGGLAAAAALSGREASVLVLEAMTDPGGYLNPFRRERYRFDTGMHHVGQMGSSGAFRALLERLGAWELVRFVEIDPDGFMRVAVGDLDVSLPAGREALLERLAARFPTEVRGISRFLGTVVALDRAVEAAAEMNTGMVAWLAALPHLPRLVSAMDMTYSDLVATATRDPSLAAVLGAFHCGLPPHRASALVPALMLRHYLDGAFYPCGGSGALRDALVAVIENGGGRIRCRTPVTRIARDTDGFTVRTPEGELRARCVVCNADPTLLYGELLDPTLVGESLRRRVDSVVPSVGSFIAYVVTDLDIAARGMGPATIQHFDSIDAVSGDDTDPVGSFGSFIVSSTTLKDPEGGHAPPGEQIVEIVAPAPLEPFAPWVHQPSMKRDESYRALKERLGWSLVRKAERYVPGLGDHVRYVDFATPATNLYWVNAPAGGCYGPAHLPTQVGRGRFGIESHVPGLLLAGHGTLAGGIYPSMRSGEIAATLASRYLGL